MRDEADERAAERDKRGDVGQLQRLEQQGFSECREATRLRKKLGTTDPASLAEAPVEETE
jgi:hypothetical protein